MRKKALLVIVVWLIAASFGGPLFGKIDQVSSNDATTYLPQFAQATEVQQLAREFQDDQGLVGIVVVTAQDKLSEQVTQDLDSALSQLVATFADVAEVSGAVISQDGRAAQVVISFSPQADIATTVPAVRSYLQESIPGDEEVYLTGPAGFSSDLSEGFAGIDTLLLGVALAGVFVILVFVYRSLLLPIVVLFTSIFALASTLLVVWWLAKADVLTINGQIQGILFILVIGAATDYSLLYVSRLREELRTQQNFSSAVTLAWRACLEPIAASGGTVIAGLMCLIISDLKSNSSLGPVAAIGIVFAMASALSFLPALLTVFGRVVFWPRYPTFDPDGDAAIAQHSCLWARLGRGIQRASRPTWITTTVVLLAGCVFVTQFQASGVPQTDLLLTSSQARDGQHELSEHFPGGSGSPAVIVLPDENLTAGLEVLAAQDDIAAVVGVSDEAPSGVVSLVPSSSDTAANVAALKVVSGNVLLQATLISEPDSATAESTVRTLRADLADLGGIVGGATATNVDTNDAASHDRNVIIPLIVLVIALILMLLLRSILAPLILIATTIISFGTALGVSALVFDHIFNFPGADPAVPLFGFVFLVALGIDYNIFLMTRVREESVRHGTRVGVIRGLTSTGGMITSAGLVLAATFAALGLIPILFLAQLAFIVAFGVLLDTFVVRSLLVPAIAYDIGDRIWWPSQLGRGERPPAS